jgi:hypothetical protein
LNRVSIAYHDSPFFGEFSACQQKLQATACDEDVSDGQQGPNLSFRWVPHQNPDPFAQEQMKDSYRPKWRFSQMERPHIENVAEPRLQSIDIGRLPRAITPHKRDNRTLA